MSIDPLPSEKAGQAAEAGQISAPSGDSKAHTNEGTESPDKDTESSLLSSILSPFSSLLSVSSPQSQSTEDKEEKPEPKEILPPEPYFAPNEVPTFKALQKKRLSGTRTKQLLRAAGRAFDDPPPPPDLGMCCGSSCDPCVNDLWREERDVWRERWGDRRVEEGNGRKDLEW